METKNCLECNALIRGRQDKKFCSDQCRNTYNNRLNSDANAQVRNINRILRKNRRILSVLIEKKGKTRADLASLKQSGFNFQYFTNLYTTKAGKVYHFCYDYGFLALEGNQYAIVRRKEYVE